MPPPSTAPASALLSISIVSYQPEPEQFRLLLQSLAPAIDRVREVLNGECQVQVIDHSPTPEAVERLCAPFRDLMPLALVHDSSNPGFGAGHNRSIRATQAPWHLILNPDVILPSDSLVILLRYLAAHPDVVVLGPEVHDDAGRLQFPCKGEPTVLDLGLRGFAPPWLRQRFDARLARYECRDLVLARQTAPARYLSGCFLLCRTDALRAVDGFDEGYFLYFEDFALCRELKSQGQVVYCPETAIVHHGGGAARKGLRHLRYFAMSAYRWFDRYGWRWW